MPLCSRDFGKMLFPRSRFRTHTGACTAEFFIAHIREFPFLNICQRCYVLFLFSDLRLAAAKTNLCRANSIHCKEERIKGLRRSVRVLYKFFYCSLSFFTLFPVFFFSLGNNVFTLYRHLDLSIHRCTSVSSIFSC